MLLRPGVCGTRNTLSPNETALTEQHRLPGAALSVLPGVSTCSPGLASLWSESQRTESVLWVLNAPAWPGSQSSGRH